MKTIRTLLFATDFSAQSEAAFPLACALARDYKARLLIIHVMPVPTVAYTMGNMAVIEPEGTKDEVRQRLEEFDPKDARVAVEHLIAQGDPATEILEAARIASCDLIVIGTHGRSGIMRMLAGSVAEKVLRHAPCPVLTVRSPAPASAPVPDVTPQEAFAKAPNIP